MYYYYFCLTENICVYGDSSSSYVVCLVVPDRNKLTVLAEKLNLSTNFEEICRSPEIAAQVLKELNTHARKVKLEKFETPRAVTLCPELWTPESGLVTAAFKLKRKPITDYYSKELKQMYETRQSVERKRIQLKHTILIFFLPFFII